MFKTLPRQLFLYLVPGMLFVLAIAGYYLDRLVDDQLIAYFDTTLDAKARSIVALTEQDEDGVELEVYDIALPLFSQITDPDYFHMVNSSGETLFVSPSAEGFTENLPESSDIDTAGVAGAFATQKRHESSLHYFDHELPDGRSGRWLAVSYFPRIDSDDDEYNVADSSFQVLEQVLSVGDILDAEGLVMTNGVLIAPERVLTFVGTSRDDVDQLLWGIDIILLLTGIAIAVGIVLIAGLGIRRAIAPLDRLGADIAALDERSLDSRIVLSKPIAELDVLVNQFNKLLERLKAAFSREQQFSVDVAHELRTPIAEMRSLIEVHARFPENTELAATYSQDLLDSTERMQHTVEQLMLLSRTEHDSIDIGTPFDLVALIERQVENLQTKAAAHGMKICLDAGHRSLITGGSRVWPMMLSNVINNAIDHASEESTIHCELRAWQDAFTMTVSNTCNDLEEADMAFLCNRLWRKDAARTDSTHSGLGLALVSAYAQRLDLEMVPSLNTHADEVATSQIFSISFTGKRLPELTLQEHPDRDTDVRVSSVM